MHLGTRGIFELRLRIHVVGTIPLNTATHSLRRPKSSKEPVDIGLVVRVAPEEHLGLHLHSLPRMEGR